MVRRPTKPDFNLNELVNRYLYILCPYIEISETDPRTERKYTAKVPIFVRYKRILDIEKQVKPELWRKYKAELFGSDTEVFSPEYYDELEIVQRLGVDFRVWEEEYSIDLRARLIAKTQLSALVDLVRRHDQLQREKANRQEVETKQKANKSSRKR